MRKMDFSKLRYVILPGSYPDPNYLNYYLSAYQCWRNVWVDAYEELELETKVYSDDFTRQTEIGAIFYEEECVGMLLMNWADLKFGDFANDSYFSLWDESDIAQLTKYGSKVIVCSHTTVAENWRKKHCPLSVKDLLFYLNVRRFKNSEGDVMTGTTRNTRGVQRLCKRFGSRDIRLNVRNFNDEDLVNLIAFYKNFVTEGTDKEVIKIGRKMWEKRIFVRRNLTYIPEKSDDFNVASSPLVENTAINNRDVTKLF